MVVFPLSFTFFLYYFYFRGGGDEGKGKGLCFTCTLVFSNFKIQIYPLISADDESFLLFFNHQIEDTGEEFNLGKCHNITWALMMYVPSTCIEYALTNEFAES